MHEDPAELVHAVDESMWLYVACDAEPVAQLVRELGWHVFERSGSATDDVDALTSADACIADVSCLSDAVVAELESARWAGRPILALRASGVELPGELQRVLAGYARSRVVTFSTSGECAARVQETFSDETWLAMLREAVPVDDA